MRNGSEHKAILYGFQKTTLCHFGTIANFLSFIVLLFIRDQTGKGVPDTQNAFFRFSTATGGWIKNELGFIHATFLSDAFLPFV
jgi:hypothetical protein